MTANMPAALPTTPPCYDADVDEMTSMGLAVLATLRERLLAWAPTTDSTITIRSVLDELDGYATELAARDDEDEDDDELTEDTDNEHNEVREHRVRNGHDVWRGD